MILWFEKMTLPKFRRLNERDRNVVRSRIYLMLESLLEKGIYLVYAEAIAAKELNISRAIVIDEASTKKVKEMAKKYYRAKK